MPSWVFRCNRSFCGCGWERLLTGNADTMLLGMVSHHDTIFPICRRVSWPFSYTKQVAMGRSCTDVRKSFACVLSVCDWIDVVGSVSFNWRMYRGFVLAYVSGEAGADDLRSSNWRVRRGADTRWLLADACLFPRAGRRRCRVEIQVMKKVTYAAYGTDNCLREHRRGSTDVHARAHEEFSIGWALMQVDRLVTACQHVAGELLRRNGLVRQCEP